MREGLIKSGPAKFDLGDLGLLGGTTERELDIITRNAATLLQGSASLFCLLDEPRASVFVRSGHFPRGDVALPQKYPLSRSLFARFIERNQSVRVTSLAELHEFGDTFEPSAMPFKSALSEPVYGPAMEPIGCLVVMCNLPRKWAELERIELRDQALLLSRHVLLRASLETLKRLCREREALAQVNRYRN
ncbi:MAG: hypothetical protein HKP54_01490 [Boseongicola sp.]|nr:hypothetical protein [Boseongicola sp.]